MTVITACSTQSGRRALLGANIPSSDDNILPDVDLDIDINLFLSNPSYQVSLFSDIPSIIESTIGQSSFLNDLNNLLVNVTGSASAVTPGLSLNEQDVRISMYDAIKGLRNTLAGSNTNAQILQQAQVKSVHIHFSLLPTLGLHDSTLKLTQH